MLGFGEQTVGSGHRMSDAFAIASNWSKSDLLRALNDALRTGVCITDRQGRFVSVSDGYCRIYGWTREELLGQPFTMVVAPEEAAALQAIHDRFIATGEELPGEWQVRRKDGSALWVAVGAALFLDKKGEPHKVTTVEDITKRRLAEIALAESRDELERLNREKNRLFSIIGHDLRSPFNPIEAYAEMLANPDSEIEPERVRTYARRIREAAGQAETLLDNLLEWARLNIENATLRPLAVPLAALVSRSVDTLSGYAGAKQVRIAIDRLDGEVFVDGYMIESAIRNLVSNAIKFTPEGGEIQISSDETDGLVLLHIRDHGIGMDDATMQSILGTESVHSRAGTNQEHGAGLGLTVAREMVARNGGTLKVTSAEGKGTTFTLALPIPEH